MSSVLEQELISLKQACKIIPTRPHVATIWRWVERGCRGHKLESWLVGGQRFTSTAALETFFAKINGKSQTTSTAKQREKAISQAEKELADLGL